MKRKYFNRLLVFALMCLFNVALNAQQSHQYDFRNTLAEKEGVGPTLNVLGSGGYTNESLPSLSCITRTVYGFTQNGGIQYDNSGGFLGTSYSIETYFRFTNNSGFIRILDFKNRTVDSGLYATNTIVQFYDELSISNNAFASFDYVHLVLTRDGGSEEVTIYLNGAFAGSFTDSNGRALMNGSNVLNFFQDDLVFGGEAQPGNIALLRLYDYTLNAIEVSDSYLAMEETSGVVAFSSDIQSAPLPGNVFNFTNESENSGGVTYSWEFGDGNTDTGTNASHSYASAGAFNVLLIVDNGGGCTDTAETTVTVTGGGGAPFITPSGSLDLCIGQDVTLTSSPGDSYLWSTGETTSSIIVNSPGDFFVTVETSPGIFENSDTVTVTRFSAIPGGMNNYSGSSVACPNTSYDYMVDPVIRNVYFTWNLPAGATVNGQNPYITASNVVTVDFGPTFSGGQISLTAHNGCGVRGPAIKNVNLGPPVTPLPTIGTSVACPGGTYTFSTNVVPNVTSYNWTAPPGAIITGQGNSSVDITFPGGFLVGFVKVTHTNPCGTSNLRSHYVRATPPKPGSITGPVSALCGSTQTYSIDPVVGAASYNWTAPTGSSVVSGQGTTTCQIAFANGLNNGVVRVTASNVCGTSAESKLTVFGGVIISDEPVDVGVCAGDPASFTVAAPGMNLIYQWRKDGINLSNGGNIQGATSATITIFPTSVADGGLYDCIVRRFCGIADTSITALLAPDAGPNTPDPVTGPGEACSGNSGFAYSVPPVVGATSYNWTGDIGVTIASGQGTNSVTIDFGPTPNSGYYIWAVALNGCGQSDTSQFWVRTTVSTPSFITSPATVCAGSNSVIYEVGAVPGASSYTWTVPANATIASGQGTTTASIDFGPGFTSGQVCVTASNTCFTSPSRCKTVNSTPAQPGNIQGQTTNVCNTTQAYTVNNAVGATGYQWTAPTGATVSSGQGTNSVMIDFGPAFVSGNIEVVSQNVCGNSSIRTRLIYASPDKPAEVFGPASVCAFSTGNAYSIAALPGATSYTWTVPIGATITSGATTNSITVDFGAGGGNVTARGNNACGSGFSKGLAVAVTCRTGSPSASDSQISVYPNPAKNVINISFTGVTETSLTQVYIYDFSGRLVYADEMTAIEGMNDVMVDVEYLVSGLYFIELNAAGSKSLSKFIKE